MVRKRLEVILEDLEPFFPDRFSKRYLKRGFRKTFIIIRSRKETISYR